jgi:hypothetical protein
VVLTKKQRNQLFTAVAESGINAAEFDLRVNDVEHFVDLPSLLQRGEALDDDWFIVIVHIPSESKFKIYQISRLQIEAPTFFAWWKVGTDPSQPAYRLEWPNVLNMAAIWASDIKDYFGTPDLWEEMFAQRELLAEASSERLENTPFTTAEQTTISAQLNEIKSYVKENLSLTREQFAEVEARIDEAEAASRRVGRKDWLLLFLGTTVQLYVTAMVPATTVQHITALVLQGLGHLFGIGGGPPPIAG